MAKASKKYEKTTLDELPDNCKALKKAREERNLTRYGTAKLMGILPNVYSVHESGSRVIGELTARRYGEFFGIDWRLLVSKR